MWLKFLLPEEKVGKTQKSVKWSWGSDLLAPPVAKMSMDIGFVFGMLFYICNYEGLSKYEVLAPISPTKCHSDHIFSQHFHLLQEPLTNP